MNKVEEARMAMQNLLAAQEELQNLPVEVEVGEIAKQIDKLIIATAAQMADYYQVEMPCNCPQKVKLTQEEEEALFRTVFDVVFENLGKEAKNGRDWQNRIGEAGVSKSRHGA